jgi:hypothetical protein
VSLPRAGALERFSCAEGLAAERAEAAALAAAEARAGDDAWGSAAGHAGTCQQEGARGRGGEAAGAPGGAGLRSGCCCAGLEDCCGVPGSELWVGLCRRVRRRRSVA